MSLLHHSALLIAVLATLIGGQAAAQDRLCAEVRAFERAAFHRDAAGRPVRNVMEYRWVGNWLSSDGFGSECVHPDAAATRLCGYLRGRTSYEWSSALPMRILECYGYRFPRPFPHWEGWTGTVSLPTRLEDRALILEMDLRDRDPRHEAIRFSSIPDREDALREPPALIDELDAQSAKQTR
jgi:hypothetical protein